MWKLCLQDPTRTTWEFLEMFKSLGDLMRYVDANPHLNKFFLVIISPGGVAIKFPFDGH